MEIWIPLISACIGGLIATVPLLLGIAVQTYLHIREENQKKREAKTQLALDLLRSDMKVLDDVLDNSLRGIGELRRIRVKYSQSKDLESDVIAELRLKIADEGDFYKLVHVNLIAEKLAYSLGDSFYSEYKNYISIVKDFFALMLSPFNSDEEKNLTVKIASSAAKLHSMMNDKLISIRE